MSLVLVHPKEGRWHQITPRHLKGLSHLIYIRNHDLWYIRDESWLEGNEKYAKVETTCLCARCVGTITPHPSYNRKASLSTQRSNMQMRWIFGCKGAWSGCWLSSVFMFVEEERAIGTDGEMRPYIATRTLIAWCHAEHWCYLNIHRPMLCWWNFLEWYKLSRKRLAEFEHAR